MNKKFLIFLFISIFTTFILTGCSKYEVDSSYTTDLYGSYSNNIKASNMSYTLDESYTINSDNTYNHIYKEIINDIVTNDIDENGKILSVEEISDNFYEITLNQKISEWSLQRNPCKVIYKYKNMIGDFDEIEVPDGKTFELHFDTGVWFDKDGQYHNCSNDNECNCKEELPKYIKKNDIIYFQSMDEEHKNYYTIGMYIIDNGIFIPKLCKVEK